MHVTENISPTVTLTINHPLFPHFYYSYRPLSRGGHFESQGNKKLCFCPSSLALDERLDGQNLLFQHCVIKLYSITKKKIGPQCVLGVLRFMLVCFYSFRLEFCFQMPVSGSLIPKSEKVDKPLRFLSRKCMVEYCSLFSDNNLFSF